MKFKIFGKEIKVMKQKGLTEAMDWCGFYDKSKSLIVVDSDLKGDDLNETIFHEFLESVFCRASFNQSINEDAKEIIIDIIAKALNENFKMVPKL
jgi:hypothetical protein